jgi:MoxR-like ATPase
MEERQVTLEGETRPLPRPFLVLATQNPIELEGTFPLPEAQLDRFLLRLRVGYPSEAEEKAIVRRFGTTSSPLDELPAIIEQAELVAMQRLARQVHVAEAVADYVVRLVRASRLHASVELGASPRATLGLYRAAQALAAINGRAYVLPDDVKRLATPVLQHRLITSAQSRLRGRAASDVIDDLLASVPVPVEEPA